MKKRLQVISVLVAVGLIFALIAPTALAGKGNEDLRALFKGNRAFAYLEALVGFGPRIAGGPAEEAAAEYIAAQMESYGLNVEFQYFDIIYFEELSPPMLEQVSPNPTNYVEGVDFATMTYSGSGDVTASVQAVDLLMPPPPPPPPTISTSGCEASDFAGFMPGNIALIQRGTCTFAQKALNAQGAGAVGVIIFNEGNTPGRIGLLFGTLGGPGVNIPVVGTTFALGEELYNLTLVGDVEVYMFTDTISEERTSQNVIGTLEGLQPDQGIVYIGGHYDSVSAGPGANDDASGVAAMLEAARVLSTKGHRTKATLKFVAFGSEETGLDGSYNYVDVNFDEVSTKGLGMINLDMIGVGDTLLIGNIGWGGDTLEDYTEQKADVWGLTWTTFTAGTNSDHTYFEMVGVPAVFLHQSPDPYYHTSADTSDKINLTKLEENGELATATLYEWAKNPDLRAKMAAQIAVLSAEKVHVYHDRVYAAE